MLNINDASFAYVAKKGFPAEYVAVSETPADPTDNREQADVALLAAIQEVLDKFGTTENEFIIMMHVQGSTESGRIIQAVMSDACTGLMEPLKK